MDGIAIVLRRFPKRYLRGLLRNGGDFTERCEYSDAVVRRATSFTEC